MCRLLGIVVGKSTLLP